MFVYSPPSFCFDFQHVDCGLTYLQAQLSLIRHTVASRQYFMTPVRKRLSKYRLSKTTNTIKQI